MRRAAMPILIVAVVSSACRAAPPESGEAATTPGTEAPTAAATTIASPPPRVGTNPPGEAARLVRAFDGDSMEVAVAGEVIEVRMLGINAPEGDECHGDAARDALIELIDEADIVLERGDDDVDQFGRLLRYVWVDGVDINAEMLTLGHAVQVQSGHPREDEYSTLALESARARRGMWARDACGPDTAYAIQIREPIEYDPPGRDSENALNEWVDIRNLGSSDVDMTGWTLRDESSVHRYRFGEVVLPPGETVRVRSGCGDDRGLDLVWCASDAVWSNGGDTAILQDEHGNVVSFVTYRGDF